MSAFLSQLARLMIGAVLFGPAPAPPGQPLHGPGGADYKHAQVVQHKYGQGAEEFWIFEPAEPTPERAPVVVFHHGWSAMNPRIYGAWIKHIVRRGNIVIFPRYQADLATPPSRFTPNAIQAVKEALAELAKPGHVAADRDRVALVGHSAGGQISANMAALAQSSGIPVPKAVMCVEPGKSWARAKRAQIPLGDMSRIPSSVLLLAVAGEDDRLVRDVDARRIFEGSTQVSPENKDFVLVRSDDHGQPPLKANHSAPVAPSADIGEAEGDHRPRSGGLLRDRIRARLKQRRENRAEPESAQQSELADGAAAIDALDYYAFWKLFDALCDAAFYGKNRVYALGNTPEQRFMGTWSDGTPVKELVITDKP